MARLNAKHQSRDTPLTYQAGEHFRDRCLMSDGSLLFDEPVWTLANLNRLREKFVDAPDTSDRNFREKYKDQVQGEAKPVIRLAAEVLAVYFLFPSNVTAYKKRELVGEVLSWGSDTLPDDHLVHQAFAAGLGSGGQGYNTRRPDELAMLIRLAIAWKEQKPEEVRQRIQDAWLFEEFLNEVEDADRRQLRHMLLHLLFPDYFESIASSDHKRRVCEAFAGLLKEPPPGTDRRLYAIRQELGRLLQGRELNFYSSPLAEAWLDSAGDIDVIQHKRQVVLYGPPGTSKTHRALGVAEQIIRSAALQRWGGARYFQQQDRVGQAIRENVHVVQLHPSFSYEEFVRGLHMSGGKTEYRPGVLLQVLERMKVEPADKRLPHVLVLDEMNRTDLSRMLGECFSLLENRDRPVRLPGRDEQGQEVTLSLPSDLYIIGTMNLIDQSVEQIDFALRRRFLWIECPFDVDVLLQVVQELWSKDPALRHGWDRVEGDFRLLASAATALNRAVRESQVLGPQYEIGHTYFFDAVYFLRQDLADAGRGRRSFLWQNGHQRRPVERLWELSLKPLLSEYLAGLRGPEREEELRRLRGVFYSPPEVEE
jgi:5-methylcytosine-specific restriction enzyme B